MYISLFDIEWVFDDTLVTDLLVTVYQLIMVSVPLLFNMTLYTRIYCCIKQHCACHYMFLFLYHPVLCLLTPHNIACLSYEFYCAVVFLEK